MSKKSAQSALLEQNLQIIHEGALENDTHAKSKTTVEQIQEGEIIDLDKSDNETVALGNIEVKNTKKGSLSKTSTKIKPKINERDLKKNNFEDCVKYYKSLIGER